MKDLAAWLFPIGFMIGLICFVTAIIDMMMNDLLDAGWAPWGLGIALVIFIGMHLAGIE